MVMERVSPIENVREILNNHVVKVIFIFIGVKYL